MSKRRMNLHPFYDVAERAKETIALGATTYQQFNCAKCGTKQTMPDPNVFHKLGICEECGHTTDIEKDGCNFMAIYGIGAKR